MLHEFLTHNRADLIERCRLEVRKRFDVELRDEIVYLGRFDAAGADGREPYVNTAH